jgi:cell division protein FtsQ|tara:strand:+ start:1645 stop:2301 length:657 start_codon:yes stop_codon:yes gene_type:complete
MKNRLIIAIALFITLSTVSSQQKIVFSKFKLKEINVENNFLIKEKEIKELLIPVIDKNLIFLAHSDVEELLIKNSLIESFNIKKKYPNSLQIKIFEKKPIAILLDKQNKFYISEKIDLIEFDKLIDDKNLPYVLGNREEFEVFYNSLKTINFPFEIIKKYTLFETNRWDLETMNKKIIKLPPENYIRSLENYLNLRNDDNFKKYLVFDFRIQDQLILK